MRKSDGRLSQRGAYGPTDEAIPGAEYLFCGQWGVRYFSMHWSEGRAAEALVHPNSIVLTREMARKYFWGGAGIGRSLVFENTNVLKVTGVIDRMPASSDIQFDALVSFETLMPWRLRRWPILFAPTGY